MCGDRITYVCDWCDAKKAVEISQHLFKPKSDKELLYIALKALTEIDSGFPEPRKIAEKALKEIDHEKLSR